MEKVLESVEGTGEVRRNSMGEVGGRGKEYLFILLAGGETSETQGRILLKRGKDNVQGWCKRG